METLKIAEVENKYGKLLIYAGDQELESYRRRVEIVDHEKYISDELESDRYSIFLDIGAEFGYFTRIAAKHCNLVYSFEAHPIRYGYLLQNTRDLPNVIPMRMFVGNLGGNKAYISDRYWEMVANKKRMEDHDVPYSELDSVPTFQLNDILLRDNVYKLLNCGDGRMLIKIDVEGNELDVLRGADRLLGLSFITWTVELHDGITDEELFNFFPNHRAEFMPEPSGKLRNYKFNME